MRAAPPARPTADVFRPPILSLAYCGLWSFATHELYYYGQSGWEWGTLAAFVTGGMALGQLAKAMNDNFKVKAHRRKKKRFDAGKGEHGQARWATAEDIQDSKILTDKQGIFIGTIESGKRSYRDVLYEGPYSISVFAPPGSLKSMGIVASTLFGNVGDGGVIVNDPSGEMYCICGPTLAKSGVDVQVISPFANKLEALIGGKVRDVGLDVFSSLRTSIDPYSIRGDLQKVAKWVIPGRPHMDEKSEFFYRGARMQFSFLSMKEIVEGRHPTLSALRYHLMKGPGGLDELFMDAEGSSAFHGVYAELARSLSGVLHTASQQFAGSYGVLEQHLDPFDHASSMGVHTEQSSWDPRVLKNPHKKTVVFVIYTLEMLEAYSQALAMTMSYLFDTIAADNQQGNVTALLDEASSLRMDLASKLDRYRKTGLRVAMFWQDMAQAEFNHGKTGFRRIMSASRLKIGMNLQEPEMLNLFSKMCGTRSITKLQLSDRAMMTSPMPDLSPNLNHEGVPLMRPEEIRMMPEDELLVVGDNLHPMRLQKLPWWKRPEWKAMAGPSPYYKD